MYIKEDQILDLTYVMNLIHIMHENTATIFNGILGFFGGAIGAFGAFYVMYNQREHEKKKEEEEKLKQIKKTLMKLQLLNEYAKRFVTSLKDEFDKPYSKEVSLRLKSSEPSILWISNCVNDVSDELLNEGFMLAYIKFNHLINHTYNEVKVFNDLYEEQKMNNIAGFFVVIDELEENIISFEKYTEVEIKKLEK